MGGQQSARRISIENDEPNNVIKVSEKVVERLKGSVEGGEKPNPPNPPRSTTSSTVHIRPRKLKSELDDEDEEVGDTSLDIKRKYEEELKQNNEYWQGRIQSLKESQERINETWEREFKRAVEDVERIFPSKSGKKLPCSDQKTVVLNCYKKNTNQPLLCANEVQAFSDCMNNVMGSQGSNDDQKNEPNKEQKK